MIANEQEYRITQAAAARLAYDLARVYEQSPSGGPLQAVVRSSLFAQLADLEDQLAEYDAQHLTTAVRPEPAPA
jgi:hypothetical protein